MSKGASGGIFPASLSHVPLDFDTLQPYGCFIGSAAVVVLSDKDTAVGAARNTMRFLLGNLAGFSDAERVDIKDMPELEQWVLHRLAELDAEVRTGYAKYDFQGVFQKLFTFATTDLSQVFFDVRKDALYCDAPSSLRRRATRALGTGWSNQARTSSSSPRPCM